MGGQNNDAQLQENETEITVAQEGNQPNNLEEAFREIRNQDPQGGRSIEDQENVQQDSIEDDGREQEIVQEGTESSVYSGSAGELGGSADVDMQYQSSDTSEIDYQDLNKNLIQSATRQAAMDANEFFKQQGIEKASINQLYQRDDNGRVTFTNPDDPDRPFSSRAEAQQWIDAYNAQVDTEWKNYAQDLQRQYINDTAPALRLIQFAPTYDSLDGQTQKAFDAIIEPYSVKDSSGMTIGYSCDLNAALKQAQNMVDIFGGGAQQTQQSQTPAEISAPPSGPATDMPTSGSDTSKTDKDEPKNLAEAFKMISKQKKKEGK